MERVWVEFTAKPSRVTWARRRARPCLGRASLIHAEFEDFSFEFISAAEMLEAARGRRLVPESTA